MEGAGAFEPKAKGSGTRSTQGKADRRDGYSVL